MKNKAKKADWYEIEDSIYWHYSLDGKRTICNKKYKLGTKWNHKFWMMPICIKCLKFWNKVSSYEN